MRNIIAFLCLVAGVVSCVGPQTEVTICSAIHGAHKSNPNYSYDDLFAFIEEQHPDVIGVEIRPEDMQLHDSLLTNYYPYEMREIANLFPDRTVVGFDWLGAEIEGQPMYATYFEEMEISQLQKQLGKDSVMNADLSALEEVRNAKIEIVLNGSLIELNDGTYDSLNTIYYDEMSAIFENTPYAALTDFYAERDQQIANNMIEIIREHPGKRLLFLTGGDHRSYAVSAIRDTFGSDVDLNAVFE